MIAQGATEHSRQVHFCPEQFTSSSAIVGTTFRRQIVGTVDDIQWIRNSPSSARDITVTREHTNPGKAE